MTLASKITIARILLIPVFVLFAAYYSNSIEMGAEDIRLRYYALVVFAIAALSDALDGYVARNFNQISKLGQVLDPVADKLLLLAGVVTLSVSQWHSGLPIWFAVLVVARDVLIIIGVLVIHFTVGKVKMNPLLTSKICTFLQMACVCWVLLDFWSIDQRPIILEVLVTLAALFTFVSGYRYALEAVRHFKDSGHATPTSHVP